MASLDTLFTISPTKIGRTLDELDSIGNRYAGTPGEAQCRDFLAEKFEEAGVGRVRLEPFRYLAYEPLDASCSVLTPYRQDLPCRPLQFTADAEVEGEAVCLGTGRREDVERLDRMGIDLAGKIVVVQSHHPFYVDRVLENRPIAALVVVSDAPDGMIADHTAALYPPPLEPTYPGRPLAYPGVTIEATAGRALISTMTCGRAVTLRIGHRARYAEKQSHNVVGEIPGTTDEQVIVGGHYDSQREGRGIWDNGSGIASLLEIARAHADVQLRRTLVIVAFALEEIGLWGSTWYAIEHAEDIPRVTGMVCLDAVASRCPGKRMIISSEIMQPLALDAARAQNWEPDVLFDIAGRAGSDYAPFLDEGIPCCHVLDYPTYSPPYYHTAGDVRSLVGEEELAEVASVSGAIVRRLATTDDALEVAGVGG